MKFCENTDKQTHTQTNRQTDRHGHYNTSPSPYGGRGNNILEYLILVIIKQLCIQNKHLPVKLFFMSQPHDAFGTRERATPEPKYLVVCENFDILYVYLIGCPLNITEYHFYK